MVQTLDTLAPSQDLGILLPAEAIHPQADSSETLHRSLGTFTIVSMNVNGQPSWYQDEPEKQWVTRAPVVRDVLEQELPDIIGTQEFGETTEEDVYRVWKESPYAIYKGERVNDIFINPISWNVTRFNARDQLTRWLTPDGNFGKAWGGIERGYSAVLLEDNTSNLPVWVYNVHLDNVSALARKEGVKLILKDIADRTDNLPTAITGDFNTARWPMPPGYGEHYYDERVPESAASDQELFAILEDSGFVDTNPYRHEAIDFPEPTFHAYDGEDTVKHPDKFGVWDPDAIFVRNLSTVAFKIITLNRDGVYPSDHYPIKATVSDASQRP